MPNQQKTSKKEIFRMAIIAQKRLFDWHETEESGGSSAIESGVRAPAR